MKDIQQLIKKNSQEGRYENIFPKTYTDAVKDKESGKSLIDILSSFNMYFLSYNGSRELTRLQVPLSLRKTGLWITYVLYDKTVVTEWYAGEAIDDTSFSNGSNWRDGSNSLVGDISVSSDGYWVVNGVITTTKAQGEQGIQGEQGEQGPNGLTPVVKAIASVSNNAVGTPTVTVTEEGTELDKIFNFVFSNLKGETGNPGIQGITPMLRVGSNNHLQVSYTNGSSWIDVSTNPVYTQFRVLNNKLQQSTDLGNTYTYISEELAYKFRESGNKLQMSKDLGNTWEDVSDYVAAWFRWQANGDNLGRVQISRDNNTWENFSPEFINRMLIKGFVANLPQSAEYGDIYMVGPYYNQEDSEHVNPYYRMWVMQDTWVDAGDYNKNTYNFNYNIKKTYESVSLMQSDSSSPVGTNGIAIQIGDIVTVVNSTTPSENGIYSYEGATDGWKYQSSFNFQVEQVRSQNTNTAPSSKLFDDELNKKLTILTGKNILDPEISITWSKYFNSNGILATGRPVYGASDFIPIKPSTIYALTNKNNISPANRSDFYYWFYDVNKVSISGVPSNILSFTTPSNAAFIRISIVSDLYTNMDVQLEEGSTRTTFSKYSKIGGYPIEADKITDGSILTNKFADQSITTPKIASGSITEDKIASDAITEDKIAENAITEDKIAENAITPAKSSFFVVGKNLIDPSKINVGGGYINIHGRIPASSSYSYTDYIKIDATKVNITCSKYAYGQGGASNAFYDLNKTFISYWKGNTATIPSNASFIRLTISTVDLNVIQNSLQCEYGTASTSYEKYGQYIDEKYIKKEAVIDKNEIAIPSNLYMLRSVKNDIFHDTYVKFWDPYKYSVVVGGLRNSIRLMERVASVVSPVNKSLVTLSLYNIEKDATVQTKTCKINVGTPSVGSTNIKVSIIGDSYTNGDFYVGALLKNNYVPNLTLVGLRRTSSTYPTQHDEGRGGWRLQDYFTVVPNTAWFFNPFMQPEGEFKFWGSFEFWINAWKCVRGTQGSDLEPKYSASSYDDYVGLFDETTGAKLNPTTNDIMYDFTNSKFKIWNGNSWIDTTESAYTWSFQYGKYIQMYSISVPDILVLYLGVNDFWITVPTEQNLQLWADRAETVANSFKAANPTGKFVAMLPNTVTMRDNTKYNAAIVHRNMWAIRKKIIDSFDNRMAENIFVLDASIAIDSENSFTLETTPTITEPFDRYAGTNLYRVTGDGQHPRVSYLSLGYCLAGFIQKFRN